MTAESTRSESAVIFPAATFTVLLRTVLPARVTEPGRVTVTVTSPGSRASKKAQPRLSVVRLWPGTATARPARGALVRSRTVKPMAPFVLLGSNSGASTMVSARTGLVVAPRKAVVTRVLTFLWKAFTPPDPTQALVAEPEADVMATSRTTA